ncbi:hypothetical protein IFM89_013668 [Coptis chinensis]|uniref:Pentatricopeptide repeat-containing protein n=1 Tax=Coptis chinensis TaxID=261450 RepID=A0A835IQU9_9MAGN|nr:hypothetical protein IFM89_013668 [Coptis chinensis]
MPERNLVSWNAMIFGFPESGFVEDSLFAFREMMELMVTNALVDMYAKCGCISDAESIFDKNGKKKVVSWKVMIGGYSREGDVGATFDLLRKMQMEGEETMKANVITLLNVLPTCLEKSEPLSIIDMYAKSGWIEQSWRVFGKLREKDMVSWMVMIARYGVHGRGKDAVELFERMQSEGLKPDEFTFISLLMACSHSGLVGEGLKYFSEMRTKSYIEPKLEHYACMVDMLGRAGHLNHALNLLEEMPEKPDAGIWGALLSSCKTHGDVVLGQKVSEILLDLEPYKAENYVLVSNLFAKAGR